MTFFFCFFFVSSLSLQTMREFFVFLCGKKEEENEKSSLGRKRGTDKSEKSSKKASSLKAKAESAETSKNSLSSPSSSKEEGCKTHSLLHESFDTRFIYNKNIFSLSLERERECFILSHQQQQHEE